MGYVLSDGIERDSAKPKLAGGMVLKEASEIPDTGTLAIVRDPQGALFALWKCLMPAEGD